MNTLLLRPLNIASRFHAALVKPMVLVNLVAIYIGRSNTLMADAMLGEKEAAQLVARSSGDGLETAKTWTLMTKLDKEALRMKALLRDI